MNLQVQKTIGKYPLEVIDLFTHLRKLLFDSVSGEITETMWAGMPSYYLAGRFIRLIPFKDHINVEANAIAGHTEQLQGYKMTPKGMLQLFVKQPVPDKILVEIFREMSEK